MALKGDLIFTPITDIELSEKLGIDELETEIAGKSKVTYTPTITEGTELGTIKINNTSKKIYAPESVENVSVTQTVTSGTELATITVDETETKIYAPTIPAEKHLEWVTVATGTAEKTWAEQLAELKTVYATLSLTEKESSIIEAGTVIFEISRCHSNASYSRIDLTASSTDIKQLDLSDTCTYTRSQINNVSGSITYSDLSDIVFSSSLLLKVLKLVDNE